MYSLDCIVFVFPGFFSQHHKYWYSLRFVFIHVLSLLYMISMLTSYRSSVAQAFPGGSNGKESPLVQETWVQSLGQEDPREEEMATHSIIFAWKIPWSEEPGEPQSIRLKRVGHDWANNTDRWWLHVDPCTNDAQICPCNLFSEAQVSISGKLAHLRDKKRIFFFSQFYQDTEISLETILVDFSVMNRYIMLYVIYKLNI